VFLSGVQETAVDEALDKKKDDVSRIVFMQSDVILNSSCNTGCNMSYLNIFTLNGEHFTICCNILLQ